MPLVSAGVSFGRKDCVSSQKSVCEGEGKLQESKSSFSLIIWQPWNYLLFSFISLIGRIIVVFLRWKIMLYVQHTYSDLKRVQSCSATVSSVDYVYLSYRHNLSQVYSPPVLEVNSIRACTWTSVIVCVAVSINCSATFTAPISGRLFRWLGKCQIFLKEKAIIVMD